jgi:hypothetical protein
MPHGAGVTVRWVKAQVRPPDGNERALVVRADHYVELADGSRVLGDDLVPAMVVGREFQ